MQNTEFGAMAFPFVDKQKIRIRPTHKQWFNVIRFSLHIFNTEKAVGFAADVIHKQLEK
jgi:hypothetical protein